MYTTDAIILKKEPSGEADLLVTALTERFVRMRLVAQGARKVEAKLKGHLEPLSLSRLSFVAGKNNYRLVGAELLNFFPALRNAPQCFRTAAEIIRLMNDILFEDRSGNNDNFFALTREALISLEDSPHRAQECGKALVWFKARALDALGLFPGHQAVVQPCSKFMSEISDEECAELSERASALFRTYVS